MTEVLDDAATALERERFFAGVEQGFERLHAEGAAWDEVLAERALEARSLGDASA